MIDRLVYAVPNFERALADLAEHTGVRPERITCSGAGGFEMAWLGLGGEAYLEIVSSLSVRPGAAGGSPPYPGLEKVDEPQLITWGLATPHVELLIEYWRAYGYDPGPLENKAFVTPSGVCHEWRETIRQTSLGDGLVPSLVERPSAGNSQGSGSNPWETRAQPSPEATPKAPVAVTPSAAPQGCILRRFHAEHPEPHKIASLLYMLDIDLYLREGPAAMLAAELGTPRGNVKLASAPPSRIDHVQFGSLISEMPVRGKPGQA